MKTKQASNNGLQILLAIIVGIAGVACRSNRSASVRGAVATTKQALDPTWTPALLSPVARYVASPEYVSDVNGVWQWSDCSGNARHVTQSFAPGKPQYLAAGWNPAEGSVPAHPAIHFDGGDLASAPVWTAAPVGASTALSVLAVIRTTVAQNAAVAGWWDPDGNGYVWAGTKNSNGQMLPDLVRDGLSNSQMFTGPHDLGSSQRHVVAWRYLPSNQTFKLTLDGMTTPSSSMAPVGNLPSMPFIIGARSLLPTGLFQGDIAELVITQSELSDEDVQNFTEYARVHWTHLPAQGSADPCVDASGAPSASDVRCDDGIATTYGDHCSSGACVGSAITADSPADMSPSAWYHAGGPEVAITDGLVSTWFDRSSNRRHLMQGFYNGRPTLAPVGWNGNKPTITFNGGKLMRFDAWTGAPNGSNAEFSVLAVLRADSSQTQTAAVAAWWNPNGAGKASCQLKSPGKFLELVRSDDGAVSQTFTNTTVDLGGNRHVAVWRFTPGVAQLTLDAVTTQVTASGSPGPMTASEFLVGVASDVSNTLLRGDVSELLVVPRRVTDDEVVKFGRYAQNEWGGLPPSLSVDDGNPCTADSITGGTATHTPLPPGTTCSDGNPCNGAETCTAAGACAAGTAPNVNDNNACTTDACSAATGVTHSPVTPGTSCSDGNLCNGAETCNGSGVCVVGTPPALNDGNPCTTDSCNASTGVAHTPVAAGAGCSDGNPCNGEEACDGHATCTTGLPPNLDDGNPCTIDACDPASGAVHTQRPAGFSCSDENKCNGFETCSATGVCVPGAPPAIDDGNPCTIDSCSPSAGVMHVPAAAGASCSDGIACNGDETCDQAGLCTAGTAGGNCATGGCQASALRVTDLHADFRDIWAGRESVASGKQAGQLPVVRVDFNAPVNPSMVAASFVGNVGGTNDKPRDCKPGAPTSVHFTPARHLATSTAAWNMDLVPARALEHVPLAFNLVTFGDIANVPSSEGPVAVGGNATLANFQINQAVQAPVGLVISGKLSASSGAVAGDLLYGSAHAVPTTSAVTVAGVVQKATPVRFDVLFNALVDLGAALGRRAPTASAQLEGSTLELSGTDPAINVFRVESDLFAAASSIVIDVPTGAAALVNVHGDSVYVSAGVTLHGATPSQVLWNFSEARHITLATASFSGSLLAPVASVSLGNGDFYGTLVADTAVGSTRFHARPLSGWASFGATANTTSVSLVPAEQLRAGCEYQFHIAAAPANSAGSCLPSAFDVSFLVASDDQLAFDREVVARRTDPRWTAPVSFQPAEGINTQLGDLFARYAEPLGLRAGLDSLQRSVRGGKSPLFPGHDSAFFEQRYRGLPVKGFGYLTHHHDEIFHYANGHLLPDIDLDVVPEITGPAAVNAALAGLNPATRPWTTTPPGGQAPSPELVVTTKTLTTSPTPQLTWRVHLFGVPDAAFVDVDAHSGEILAVGSKHQHLLPPIACNGFDPATARYLGGIKTDVSVPLDVSTSVERNDLSLGRWKQGSDEYRGYLNATPFQRRTTYVDLTDPALDINDPITSANSIEFVCATPGDSAADQVAAAHWSMQAAAAAFSKLTFAGEPWRGMTGPDGRGVALWLEKTALAPGCDPFNPPADNGLCESAVVRANDRALATAYEAWDPTDELPPDEEDITVEVKNLQFAIVSHEFAHGMLNNARFQANAGGVLYYSAGEAGALNEGYADLMASVANLWTLSPGDVADPWCLPEAAPLGGCMRNLADPTAPGNGPGPDTYLVPPWEECVDKFCNAHKDSTVLGHWFYLLVNGQDGSTPNGLGCAVSVNPISLEEAAQLVFDTFTILSPTATFAEARETTLSVAKDEKKYGADVAPSVEQAWLAVGVGNAPEPATFEPANGAKGVEPWYATFRWDVGEQIGPWTLSYSEHSDMHDARQRVLLGQPEGDHVSDVFVEEGRRYVSDSVSLKPGTKYYWQVREGYPDDSSSRCSSFTASFKTANKTVDLLEPVTKTGSYYQLDASGTVVWTQPAGTYDFEVNISEDDTGCDASQAIRVGPAYFGLDQPPFAFIGDTIEPNDQQSLLNYVPLLPDENLNPNHTYHLYIRPTNANTLDGPNQGSCAHFPFRKTQLRPFTLVSPLAGTTTIPTLEYNAGGPFVWTPSDGADSYTIYLDRLDPFVPPNEEHLGQEHLGQETVTLNDSTPVDGGLAYYLADPTIINRDGQIFWSVTAHQGQFSQSGLEPRTQVNLVTNAEAFVSAAEPTTFWGIGGVFDPDTTGTLDQPGTTEVQVRFDTTSSGGPPLHEGSVCINPGPNTAGAWWWLGDSGAAIDPADVHDAPGVTGEGAGCIGPDFLALASDDMDLIVVPYSNIYADGPHGFGTQHIYHLVYQDTDCGFEGGHCCPLETDQSRLCVGQQHCVDTAGHNTQSTSGTCEPCGEQGQVVCDTDDPRCAVATRPLYSNAQHYCLPCGFKDEPCCPASQFRTCPDEFAYGLPINICKPNNCSPCGNLNQPCCENDQCPEAGPDVSCQGGTCLQDPSPDGSNAAGSRTCSEPFSASGHATSGWYHIDVKHSTGKFLFHVNTYEVKDSVRIYQAGTLLSALSCLGTQDYASYIPVEQTFGEYLCDDDFSGNCQSVVQLNGHGTTIDVLIGANCDGSTDETDWDFTVDCAK